MKVGRFDVFAAGGRVFVEVTGRRSSDLPPWEAALLGGGVSSLARVAERQAIQRCGVCGEKEQIDLGPTNIGAAKREGSAACVRGECVRYQSRTAVEVEG